MKIKFCRKKNSLIIAVTLILLIVFVFLMVQSGKSKVCVEENEVVNPALNYIYQEIRDSYLNLEYKENHLDLDWEQEYLTARNKIVGDVTPEEEFMILGNFVHNLKDGHVRFKPVENYQSELFRHHNYEGLLDIRWIEDKPVAVTAPKHLGVAGKEILKFNGLDFTKLVDDTVETWGGGGNRSQARDRVLLKELFYLQYQLQQGKLPGKLNLTVKDKGKSREVSWPEPDSGSNTRLESMIGLNQSPESRDESLKFNYDENAEAGILQINDFRVHPAEMEREIEKWLNKLREKNARGVVLDLRYNMGGNESFRTLLQYLIEEPMIVGHYRYRYSRRFLSFHPGRVPGDIIAGRRSPGPAGEGYSGYWHWKISPAEESFLREVPVVVLANSATFSAGDIFVRMALTHDLARVLGQELVFSGHGLTEYTKLPCGRFKLGFGLQELRDENYQIVENITANPDRKIDLKLEEVRAGRDNQLNAALEFIEKAN